MRLAGVVRHRQVAILAAIGLFSTTSLIGTDAAAATVTGGLSFRTRTGANYFDALAGYVPETYGNFVGNDVEIGSGVEFGYADRINTDTADFDDSGVTITNVGNGAAYAFFMVFSADVAGFFNNATFASNTFGATFTVRNGVLIFAAPATNVAGTRTARITFAGAPVSSARFAPLAVSAPEPATWAMMIAGFGFVGAALRRNRRRTVRVSYSG